MNHARRRATTALGALALGVTTISLTAAAPKERVIKIVARRFTFTPNRATRATIAFPESDRPDGREPAMPLPRSGS